MPGQHVQDESLCRAWRSVQKGWGSWLRPPAFALGGGGREIAVKAGAFCLPYSAPCTRFLCFLLDIASGLHIINKHTQLRVPTTWTPSLLLLRTPSSKTTFLFVWYLFPLKAFYSIEEDQLSVIHKVPQAGTPEHGCRFQPCSGKPSVKVGSLGRPGPPPQQWRLLFCSPMIKGSSFLPCFWKVLKYLHHHLPCGYSYQDSLKRNNSFTHAYINKLQVWGVSKSQETDSIVMAVQDWGQGEWGVGVAWVQRSSFTRWKELGRWMVATAAQSYEHMSSVMNTTGLYA